VVTLVSGRGPGCLRAAGLDSSPGLVAVTLSATSLGLVVPVLKEPGQLERRLGQTVIAAASVADFAAIVLLSLFFSRRHSSTAAARVLLVQFALLVIATAVAVTVVARSRRLEMTLTRLQDTTAQIRVRAAGRAARWPSCPGRAFRPREHSSGRSWPEPVVSLVDQGSVSIPISGSSWKPSDSGSYPSSIVTSGLRLDVSGLVDHPSALAGCRFAVALLVVRGTPALLYAAFRPSLGARGRLLQATSLPGSA